MLNLEYHDVRLEKSKFSNQAVIKGEVTNKTGRNYTSLAIRVIFFKKNISVVNIVLSLNGLPSNPTKVFEKNVEDLEFDAVAKDITNYEIYTESAYWFIE